MPGESAIPPVTSGAVRLDTGGLMSKWGFDDGDPFIEHDDLYPAIDGVDSRTLLVELVKQFVLPVLDQAVEVEVIGTCHNPVRACRVDGVHIQDEVHYGRLPEPVELTPDCVEVPYAQVIEVAAELQGQADA
jgi:hypothetical protein